MRATYVWILLIVLTIITWGAGKAGLEGFVLGSGLLVSVWIKGHFVIADFMGLRGAPMLWRALTHGWLVLVMGLIFIAYMIGA